jgi:small-conductance mechanosensitive channel
LFNQSKPAILILLLLLWPVVVSSVQAQTTRLPAVSDVQAEDEWNPPDLLNLPPDWLATLETADLNADLIQASFEKFTIMASERIQGLDPQNMSKADAALVTLKNNVISLLATIRESPDIELDPIPSLDFYTLEGILTLRAMWREVDSQVKAKQDRLAQSRQQYRVLQQKTDTLVQQYSKADSSAPSKIVIGLNRMASGVELLVIGKTNSRFRAMLLQLEDRREELVNKLEFARRNLAPERISSGDFDFAINAANEALAKIGTTSSALQQQLLDSASGDDKVDFFLELKLKQQLTLASARKSLLAINQALDRTKKNWHLLREGKLDSATEFNNEAKKNNELIGQLSKQASFWNSASQTTLITPGPSSNLKQQTLDFSKAQDAARETLKVIKRIEGASDDLSLTQDLTKGELVGLQRGLSGAWARLSLITGTTRQNIQKAIEFKLFYIGDSPVTPASLVEFVFIILLGLALSWLIRRMLQRLQKRAGQDIHSASIYTLGRLLHYFIMTVAVLAAFASLGLDVSSLTLIAGALSVGIGFGLQSIVNNFLSGLILLFEGSLKVGDFIELDSGVTGIVKEISTRYTRINTNDNVDVVVPNSELVSFKLTNYTLREPIVRIRIPFGVAYGTDKELVRKAALEAADEVPFTMKSMPGRKPDVLLVNFGDSSLEFQLRVWVDSGGVHRPVRVKASYYWALESKFREYGIKIPFPQRDLHLHEKSRQASEDLVTE